MIRWVEPTEPALSRDYAELMAGARWLLAGREAYAEACADEERADADEAVRLMRAIVADWQRIEDLLARRDAQPRDTSATADEKRVTLRRALARVIAAYDQAEAALLAVVSAQWRMDFACGIVSRRDLFDAYNANAVPRTEALALMQAQQRYSQVNALLWHADRNPDAMFYAELTVKLRERANQRAAA